MIDPKAITTYAQYNEDLILAALLHDVKKGFYIDVGANYPVIDSATFYFYQRGWRGINIEPLKSLYQQLKEQRREDTNLNIGLGDKKGKASFREYTDMPGHSTFDSTRMEAHGQSVKHTDYEVKVETLKDIISKYKPAHIHFIKIDVEGFEYQVVAGNDWQQHRPEIVCIEASHVSQDWRSLLIAKQYKLFVSDGLNEYYIARESWQRTKGFDERIVKLDYHALKQHQAESWLKDSQELVRIDKVAQDQQKLIDNMKSETAQLREMAVLSLRNRPWISRFKRAVYGLTIDWLRYKKASKQGPQ